MEWNSGFHTNTLIPFYAKGIQSRFFWARADNEDPIRGPYIDNTDVAEVIFDLLNELKTEPQQATENKRERRIPE
jgi:alkaline phosphatase